MIIPVFIPYQGCPHKCIYCRQDKITNQPEGAVHGSDVQKTIEQAINSNKFSASTFREVAFYGGTFTSLGFEKMGELLNSVLPYIRDGIIDAIRVSTRPDEIDESRLEFIKIRKVHTVELGVQSMDDNVLKLSARGHTAEDTVNAVRLLKEFNFQTGVQIMPGLPGDSEEKFLKTIDRILKLKPNIARLYPAIVIKNTPLERIYLAGKYNPLSLDEAIKLCSKGCTLLETSGIKVIRIGLMSSPSLLEDGQIVAGPWHSAFGYLVRSEIYLNRISRLLPEPGSASEIGIRVPAREIPLLRGYKNRGIKKIEDMLNTKIRYIKPENSIETSHIEVDIIE